MKQQSPCRPAFLLPAPIGPGPARSSRGQPRSGRGQRAGFTLVELMIVITIILLLLGMAAVNYRQSLHSAKEAALKQDLDTMRRAIQAYTLDKQQAPTSLDELVSAGYLREIPADPICGQKNWRVVYEDIALSPDQTGTGITDVFSSCDKVSPRTNTPYSTW